MRLASPFPQRESIKLREMSLQIKQRTLPMMTGLEFIELEIVSLGHALAPSGLKREKIADLKGDVEAQDVRNIFRASCDRSFRQRPVASEGREVLQRVEICSIREQFFQT